MKFFSVLTIAALVLSSTVALAASKKATVKRFKPVHVIMAKQYPLPPRKVAKRNAVAPATMAVMTPCGEVQTPPQMRVTENTAGYRRVEVTVDMAHTVPVVKDRFPLQVMFMFGIDTLSKEIRKDELGAIKWVSRCERDVRQNGRFFQAGTTWLKVTGVARESDIWEGNKGLTLRADAWLPESVIEAESAAFTVLKDNMLYTGTWEIDDAGKVTLALK